MGSVYKLITKVLARRMARVMEKAVEEDHRAFIGRRQILVATLIINEITEELKHKNLDEILYKLNMEKAYDHVNWEFQITC